MLFAQKNYLLCTLAGYYNVVNQFVKDLIKNIYIYTRYP